MGGRNPADETGRAGRPATGPLLAPLPALPALSLDDLAKLVAAAMAVLYAIGFLAINLYLLRFGAVQTERWRARFSQVGLLVVVPAAVGAILLNTNIILSGMGTVAFDGRIIAIEILFILAWRVVTVIGLQALVFRILRNLWKALQQRRMPTLRAMFAE